MAIVVQRGPTQQDLSRRQRQREFGQDTRLRRRQLRLRERQQDFNEAQRDIDNQFRAEELNLRARGLEESLVARDFDQEMQTRRQELAEQQFVQQQEFQSQRLEVDRQDIEARNARADQATRAQARRDCTRQLAATVQDLSVVAPLDVENFDYTPEMQKQAMQLRSQLASIQTDPSLDPMRKVEVMRQIQQRYADVEQAGVQKQRKTPQQVFEERRGEVNGVPVMFHDDGTFDELPDRAREDAIAAREDQAKRLEDARRAAHDAVKAEMDASFDSDSFLDPERGGKSFEDRVEERTRVFLSMMDRVEEHERDRQIKKQMEEQEALMRLRNEGMYDHRMPYEVKHDPFYSRGN